MLGFLESIFLQAKQAFANQDLAKKILLILLMIAHQAALCGENSNAIVQV